MVILCYGHIAILIHGLVGLLATAPGRGKIITEVIRPCSRGDSSLSPGRNLTLITPHLQTASGFMLIGLWQSSLIEIKNPPLPDTMIRISIMASVGPISSLFFTDIADQCIFTGRPQLHTSN